MSKRAVIVTKRFKREAKKHYLALLTPAWGEIFSCLLNDIQLPEKYKDHALSGEWQGCRDCHIKSDLVLIYEIDGDELILIRIGSHSELFG